MEMELTHRNLKNKENSGRNMNETFKAGKLSICCQCKLFIGSSFSHKKQSKLRFQINILLYEFEYDLIENQVGRSLFHKCHIYVV